MALKLKVLNLCVVRNLFSSPIKQVSFCVETFNYSVHLKFRLSPTLGLMCFLNTPLCLSVSPNSGAIMQ